MKRFAAYDPPEYVTWAADPELVEDFRARVDADPERAAIIRALDEAALLGLYEGLLRNRLHDIALKRWVKSGVISKAWLGVGEEAATIGPVHALRRSGPDHDVVSPMIRNVGACHEMGMSVADLLRGYLGTADGPSGGRDLHTGDLRYGVLTPISHVGDVVPVTAGMALAFKQRGEDRVALNWVGDGSTKTAAFHEGMNFAAVQRLPCIYIIHNNQVALGTKLAQHCGGEFHAWPAMYGVAGGTFDGNHVLDAFAATRIAADRARRGEGVTLLVAETFRMGGHATHDEREARALFDADFFGRWGKRDPIGLYEAWLEEEGFGRDRLEEIEAAVSAEVDAAAEEALRSRETAMPLGETAELGVYA
ncbi:MAG TPA: thiamine pyrophosphate-dependent enzyme [Longimicrobiaceae bacterium]|jgi:pyruvate dehydrogenase E1 component alpha subunit/2-oxoisovalerate dehydrogenase E1 component alpha subunit|nr:thiamine pyrophosphate-dependent enzyme [Longimicrobiaceae bacterium]